jgi:hypothetical protein
MLSVPSVTNVSTGTGAGSLASPIRIVMIVSIGTHA